MIIVFVHGWSVTNLNTYGELPVRIRNEAARLDIQLDVREIFLGKYISFHDEVRLEDISAAFVSAVREHQLEDRKFVCVTHSTGGPVIRDWWHRFYKDNNNCPLSHLIMLAPANNGSALAQLGKARIGRLKSWFDGVEPGQGVLDWLEVGSSGSWNINKEWTFGKGPAIGATGPFPFVITGQSIDRKLYDHLNSYTGENGSDGVVRAAAANLNNRYILLSQKRPVLNEQGVLAANELEIAKYLVAPPTPFRIVKGKAHSGEKMGIMASVKAEVTDLANTEIVSTIFSCMQVKSMQEFQDLIARFEEETKQVQKDELVEYEDRLLSDRYFIHDRCAMVVFKVVDSHGYPVRDYDLIITAGKENDPNLLPEGFFVDRQRNRLNGETITYYFNADIIHGTEQIVYNGKELRPRIPGIDRLGLEIIPRPDKGFVHYLPGRIDATPDLLKGALVPNTTTLVEICLHRIIHQEVFQLDELADRMPSLAEGDFKKSTTPGTGVV